MKINLVVERPFVWEIGVTEDASIKGYSPSRNPGDVVVADLAASF